MGNCCAESAQTGIDPVFGIYTGKTERETMGAAVAAQTLADKLTDSFATDPPSNPQEIPSERRCPLTRRNILLGTAGLAGGLGMPGLAAAATAATAPAALKGVVHTGQRFPAINPLFTAGFLEHGANIINHTMWAEIFHDHKFYYGIQEKGRIQTRSFEFPCRHGLSINGRPSAPCPDIFLDKTAPYVGDKALAPS